MTRIAQYQLVQALDVEVGQRFDVVLIDESSGEEIVVQHENLLALEAAVHYFRTGEPLVMD